MTTPLQPGLPVRRGSIPRWPGMPPGHPWIVVQVVGDLAIIKAHNRPGRLVPVEDLAPESDPAQLRHILNSAGLCETYSWREKELASELLGALLLNP